jgi:hypothetical protein
MKKKIDKDQFEKTKKYIIKRKKENHVGKYCRNPQCFKEKNYIAKFPTSSIFKKKLAKIIFFKKNKTIKKTKKMSILEKKTCKKKEQKLKKFKKKNM